MYPNKKIDSKILKIVETVKKRAQVEKAKEYLAVSRLKLNESFLRSH